MSRYRPTYLSHYEQPLNSRHYPDRSLHRNRNQNQPAQQVDSWRSYRNDATNLQQSINFNHSQGYDQIAAPHDSLYHWNQYSLNPTASVFQPVNQVQSAFTPCQSVRVSNQEQERRIPQQSRYTLAATNDEGGRQNALLARGPANPRTALRDNQLYAIDQQTRYSSSVPINLISRPKANAATRDALRAPDQPACSPSAPSPTQEYLTQATIPARQLATPQKLLVVLDLNGTLLKRSAHQRTSFVLRPGVSNFMDYLFANHVVMIYSSARPENVQGMVAKLLSPKQRNKLAAVWARDRLELDHAQYHSKVQVYKKLEKIWADLKVQQFAGKGRTWDQSNTVLLDDSHLKALAQPYNLLRVEEFTNDRPGGNAAPGEIQNKKHLDALDVWRTNQLQIVRDLEVKLEELKWTEDVSQMIRQWQVTNAEEPVVAKKQISAPEPVRLMTPINTDFEDSESDQSDGGADARQQEVNDLVQQLGQECVNADQSMDHHDCRSDRSVSPIDEAIWRDILGGVEQVADVPPTPKSMDT